MDERRGLNPRVVDSQSTALIHLATSALEEKEKNQSTVSIYDHSFQEEDRSPDNKLTFRC